MSAPIDPVTALAAGAAQVHELFSAYVGAGFSEQQALYIVANMLAAMLRIGSAS